MEKRHTIKDVAKLAGVSLGTVSNVLNKKPIVANETVGKVKAAARTLKYQPSFVARNLRCNKSEIISLHLVYLDEGDMSHSLWDFYYQIIMGFTNTLKKKGLKLHLEYNRLDDLTDDELLMKALYGHSSRGVAFVIPMQKAYIGKILSEDVGFPIVSLFSKIKDSLPSVRIDNYNAVFDAVHWLQDLGHKEIAFVGGRKDDCTALERQNGYRAAMKSKGYLNIRDGDWTIESGIGCMQEIVSRETLPTAVFCANDHMAMGVLHVCRNHSIRIPEDMSVIGFDDSLMCQVSDPQLASLDMPLYEMGMKGAEILLGFEETGTIEHHVFAAKLKQRGSVTGRTRMATGSTIQ
jgi:LacI family transcriptional regulator